MKCLQRVSRAGIKKSRTRAETGKNKMKTLKQIDVRRHKRVLNNTAGS